MKRRERACYKATHFEAQESTCILQDGEEGLEEVDEQRYMTLNSLKYKGRVRLKEKSYIELGDGEVKNTIDQKKT